MEVTDPKHFLWLLVSILLSTIYSLLLILFWSEIFMVSINSLLILYTYLIGMGRVKLFLTSSYNFDLSSSALLIAIF